MPWSIASCLITPRLWLIVAIVHIRPYGNSLPTVVFIVLYLVTKTLTWVFCLNTRSFSPQVEVGRTSSPLVQLITPLPEDVRVYDRVKNCWCPTLDRVRSGILFPCEVTLAWYSSCNHFSTPLVILMRELPRCSSVLSSRPLVLARWLDHGDLVDWYGPATKFCLCLPWGSIAWVPRLEDHDCLEFSHKGLHPHGCRCQQSRYGLRTSPLECCLI
jgi:hypothetical protein